MSEIELQLNQKIVCIYSFYVHLTPISPIWTKFLVYTDNVIHYTRYLSILTNFNLLELGNLFKYTLITQLIINEERE